MKKHAAFTMIELIFVIVVMGILGKFGVEFLAQAYKSFIFSSINNELEQNSATALEIIGSRLQYRIKDSTITRVTDQTSPPLGLGSSSGDVNVLEWVASDIDGFRGDSKPLWSGIIDLDASSAGVLESPETNTSALDTLIQTLSYGDSSLTDAAIYFIGSNSDVISGYGWSGALLNQNGTMHPIQRLSDTQFQSSLGVDFTGVDIYEYYKLAWTANAIVYVPEANNMGTLKFYYDYQPWAGEKYTDGKSSIIMRNVSAFRFMAIDAIIKIQVCVKSDVIEEYSLCKEKTIF